MVGILAPNSGGQHLRSILRLFSLDKLANYFLNAKSNPVLNCSNMPSFEEFTILVNGNNQFVLEIKESWLIKQDRTIFNENTSSVKWFLFENS